MPLLQVVAVALLKGALIQISQVFYFEALSYSEASIVAAYWNITPIVLPIASFLLFGKVFQFRHYLGIATLITASVSLCLANANFEARWKSFYLMIFACCVQAAALLLEEYIFGHSSFFVGYLLATVGIIISGILPLLIPSRFLRHLQGYRIAFLFCL
ncbi:hypothetical protein NDI45_14790 [Leptolyngbya sp. GB1-A1]|uniref:hypothetical protein n=1 Tax=Leptolyngbya sp. GB1-A1 TaxID=2933908 RepID=UPI003296D19C